MHETFKIIHTNLNYLKNECNIKTVIVRTWFPPLCIAGFSISITSNKV